MKCLSQELDQIKALKKEEELQCILDEAYVILGNPLVLFDMEYKMIACTKNIVTDDPLWNEIVGTGLFSGESIKFFMNECFIDAVASTNLIAILKSDKLKYERFYGRIFNSDNSTVADLIMVACNEPFKPTTSDIFMGVCERLSEEVSTSEFYWRYAIIYHQALICELLEGDIDNKLIYSDHVANLYEGLKTNVYVVVLDFCDYNPINGTLEDFRDMLKKMLPEFKYGIYAEHIVMIISTDEMTLDIDRDLGKLNEIFENNNIHVGTSGLFENLFELQEHYREALASLECRRKNNCS